MTPQSPPHHSPLPPPGHQPPFSPFDNYLQKPLYEQLFFLILKCSLTFGFKLKQYSVSDNGLVALIITAGSLDDISALFAFSLARVPAFEKEGVGWFILTALIWTVCSISVALCKQLFSQVHVSQFWSIFSFEKNHRPFSSIAHCPNLCTS